MKFCYIILAIVFSLITVKGRNFHQQETNTDLNENVDIKHVRNKPERRLRNPRQSFYNYHHDYLNSFQNFGVGDFLKDILFSVREIETQMKQGAINIFYPGHYDNRPSYSSKCEDTLKELITLYKELAPLLKYSHPPPPPQIIYVKYPVPDTLFRAVDKKPSNVNITIRNIPEDTKPVLMHIPKNTDTEDDVDIEDGARPVSFKPKQPSSIPKITPPPFEHGSKQAGVIVSRNSKPNYNNFILPTRFGKKPQKPRQFK